MLSITKSNTKRTKIQTMLIKIYFPTYTH